MMSLKVNKVARVEAISDINYGLYNINPVAYYARIYQMNSVYGKRETDSPDNDKNSFSGEVRRKPPDAPKKKKKKESTSFVDVQA